MRDNSKYLKVSPDLTDCGNFVGKHPSELSISDLEALGHPKSLTSVIRAKCLDCVGDQPSEVRKCVATDCPLWPFRMGKNPFHARSKQMKESKDGG